MNARRAGVSLVGNYRLFLYLTPKVLSISLIIFSIFSISIELTPLPLMADDSKPHVRDNLESSKPARPGEYGKHRSDLKLLCDALALDSRNDLFGSFLEPLVERDQDCLDCRPFVKLWVSICRSVVSKSEGKKAIKKKSQNDSETEDLGEVQQDTEKANQDADLTEVADGEADKEEGDKTKIIKNPFLPGILQVDAASILGRSLASREEVGETIKALNKIVKFITESTKLSDNEREYGLTILTYIMTPIEERIKEIAFEDTKRSNNNDQNEAEENKIKEELFPTFR